MSTNSIARAANDADLRARVTASANALVQTDPIYGDTEFGFKLLNGFTSVDGLVWQVAVDVEGEYESALINGRGSPGHDLDVITEQRLNEAVKAHWPPNAYVPPPTMPLPDGTPT